jgi:hypothetical protein
MTQGACAYDALGIPIVAARAPLMPVQTALRILDADDPISALRTFLTGSQLARLAIRVASSPLADEIDAWCAPGAASDRTVALRALAYLSRMCTRPTPYGLYAGIGMVDVGTETSLTIDLDGRRTRTRPDMELIADLRKSVETGASRGLVRYVANEAVLNRGGRLYVTNVVLANPAESKAEQRSVTLKETPAVAFVRDMTVTPTAYHRVVEELSTTFETPPDECSRVLDALIDAGVVISELHAPPIGDQVGTIIARLCSTEASLERPLSVATQSLRALDATPLAERTAAQYSECLEGWSAVVEKPTKTPFQADMHVPFQGTLAEGVLNDAARLGEYFMRMAGRRSLAKYRERFLARYGGYERMVQLLELTDSNLGLGAPDEPEFTERPNSLRDELLARLTFEAVRTGRSEIQLTDDQVSVLVPPLSDDAELDPLEIGFQVAAESREAVNRGDYLVVTSGLAGSIGVARSLGRFMDLLPSIAQERARAALEETERSGNEIRAELVFAAATDRNYNVFVRPSLIEREISIGVVGDSAAARLPLEDLWVGVDGQRFFLWSASQRRRVLPIESHMGNTPYLAPNICRLLSLVGADGKLALRGFHWGRLANLTALPRVSVGRVVLAPAQWYFGVEVFGKDRTTVQRGIDDLRSAWRLPRYVSLCEGDNRLSLDLESNITADLLLDRLRHNELGVRLQEMLPTPSQTWLGSEGSTYVAEFVATLLPRRVPPLKTERRDDIVTLSPRKRYAPGSQWVYAKLYVGAQATEDLLLHAVAPLLRSFSDAGIVDRWFFLRYADPDEHLRVRIRARAGYEARVRDACLAQFEALLAGDRVQRVAFDSYDPEYERYGGSEGIDSAEEFFSFDSDRCLVLVASTPKDSDSRIAASAASFFPWLAADDDYLQLALDAFKDSASGKLGKKDREALKRFDPLPDSHVEPPGLGQILRGSGASQRLSAVFHMHCNRLGVTPRFERRSIQLLRSMLLSSKARRSKKDSRTPTLV